MAQSQLHKQSLPAWATNDTSSYINGISAWIASQKSVLGQVKVDDKSSIITAISELLNLLYLKGKQYILTRFQHSHNFLVVYYFQ